MNPAWTPSGIVLDLVVVLVVEIQPVEYEDDDDDEDDNRTSGKAGSWVGSSRRDDRYREWHTEINRADGSGEPSLPGPEAARWARLED